MIKSAGQALPPGLKPQKRLGQNFLWQRRLLNKMIAAAELSGRDLVLEIGPGLGSLTQALAKKAKRVITVEKDPRLIPILQTNLREYKNVMVVQGDIRELVSRIWYLISGMTGSSSNTKHKTQNTRYKVVANLPYYLATTIIRQFLEAENPPELMVLMLQKEVAQRICARPPKMSLLAVSVQLYADVKIISSVSKKAFWPKPKVDSAIIKIIPRENLSPLSYDRREVRTDFKDRFFKIVKAGFSQPRKQLLNNLSKGLNLSREEVTAWLGKNKISSQQRPANLALKDWLALTKSAVDINSEHVVR